MREVLQAGIFPLSQKLEAIKGSSMNKANGNQEWQGKKLWIKSSSVGKGRKQHGQKYFRLPIIPFRQNLNTAQTESFWLLKSRFGH